MAQHIGFLLGAGLMIWAGRLPLIALATTIREWF